MKARAIQPNFKIPKGYRRTFIFQDEGETFRQKIVVNAGGIRITGRGGCDGMTGSRCLDWIQESIEAVRWELTQGK